MNNKLVGLNKIPYKKRTNCAVCEKELDTPIIELPDLPLTEILVDQKPKKKLGFIDQNFHFCSNCSHAQLSLIIDPKILYGFSYSFKTSKSKATMQGNDFFSHFIKHIIKDKHFKNIIEIGCNDLYLLNLLKENGEKLIGVDPILKGKEDSLSDSKISVIGDFFENVDIKSLFSSGDSLVLSSHNLEHIKNPRSMIKKLLDNASKNDIFIFQFPGLETLVENYRFDQIFHHHLHYFSLKSFEYLVNDLGGELIAFDVNKPFWGTLLVAFKKGNNKKTFSNHYSSIINHESIAERYELFKKRMALINKILKSSKKPIFGYGAILTLPMLAYYLNNDFSDFTGIIDDDPNKEGMFYLNLPVPIMNSSKLKENSKDATILITAINNIRQILPKLLELNPKKIILPINDI